MLVSHVIKATGLAGAEAHLLALLPALKALGIDSELIVLEEAGRRPEAFLSAARVADIDTTAMPIYSDVDPTLPFRLARHWRTTHPTIVHTHLFHADLHGSAAMALANYQLPTTLFSSRHNDDRFRRLALVKTLNRAAMRRARKIVAISDAIADFVVRVESAPKEKVVRIHYGLDPKAYLAGAAPGSIRRELGLDAATPLVGFVGRLTAQKGVETLIAAWPQFAARVPNARLIIVGDGELRPKLERLTNLQSLIPNPCFLGWRSDVPSLMCDIDVLVVPSRWEGFGIVTLEAMAACKPVIASRVSALPEIVADGETGLLVPPGDSQALAQSLISILCDPARAREMGRKGRQRLEAEFSVEQMVGRHIEVYHGDYLPNLLDYEERLTRGEIQW